MSLRLASEKALYGCSGWERMLRIFFIIISWYGSVARLMHPERQFPKNPGPAKSSRTATRSDPEHSLKSEASVFKSSVSVASPSGTCVCPAAQRTVILFGWE
jgi:hypothetical protein